VGLHFGMEVNTEEHVRSCGVEGDVIVVDAEYGPATVLEVLLVDGVVVVVVIVFVVVVVVVVVSVVGAVQRVESVMVFFGPARCVGEMIVFAPEFVARVAAPQATTVWWVELVFVFHFVRADPVVGAPAVVRVEIIGYPVGGGIGYVRDFVKTCTCSVEEARDPI
jgi:hypothetical protein